MPKQSRARGRHLRLNWTRPANMPEVHEARFGRYCLTVKHQGGSTYRWYVGVAQNLRAFDWPMYTPADVIHTGLETRLIDAKRQAEHHMAGNMGMVHL